MKIVFDKSKCVKCGLCVEACPLGIGVLGFEEASKVFNCFQECSDCQEACKANAFYEAGGVIGIDPEKCNACGECVNACKLNAIVIVDSKAVKCNLCADREEPECVKACPYNALRLELSDEEKRLIDEVIGWRKKFFDNVIETIEVNEFHEVVSCTDGLKYLTNSTDPCLEEALVSKAFAENLDQYEPCEESLLEFLKAYGEENKVNYPEGIISSVLREAVGFSFFELFLKDPLLEEIAFNGCGSPLFVYHEKYGWLETDVKVTNEERVVELVNKMIKKTGRRLNYGNPLVDAELGFGRINAVIPPISKKVAVTIRKLKKNAFDLKKLVENKTLSSDAAAFLSLCVEIGCNMLICGNSGSGKTTLLNALLEYSKDNERIVIIEQTPEIKINKKHVVSLVSNEKTSMVKLVENTFRMRPDKVVVGEIRTPVEVMAFIQTILSGQAKSSFATFHAESGEDAVKRLKKYGIKDEDLKSIDVIVVQKRWEEANSLTDKRRVTEVLFSEDNGFLEVFEYDMYEDCLAPKKLPEKFLKKAQLYFSKTREEVINELKVRAYELRELSEFC